MNWLFARTSKHETKEKLKSIFFSVSKIFGRRQFKCNVHFNSQKEGSLLESWLDMLLELNEMGLKMVHACSPFGGFADIRHLHFRPPLR